MGFCFRRRHSVNPKSTKVNNTHQANTHQANTQQQYHDNHGTQSLLSSAEAVKLRRLRKDGIIILVDQPNLETGKVNRLIRQIEKEGKQGYPCWTLSYGSLKNIIARRGDMSNEPRKVLGTYIITSKSFQNGRRHCPSRKYLERHKIELIRPPDERDKVFREKAVDCTLVRIMTQEFEGIEMQRLNGKTPPKRTFCLVAGDFDYVDVVRQAREYGCDVEIWYWTKDGMSGHWYDQLLCAKPGCGCLAIKDLQPYEKMLERSWQDNSGAWSLRSNLH